MLELFGDYNAGDVLWLGDWSPGWIALLVVLGLAVIGLSIYDLRPMRRSRRWTLVGLRAAVYALAVMLLLEPAVDLKNITRVKNHVAVLVDQSRSMSLEAGAGEGTRYARAVEAVEALRLPGGAGGPDQDEEHVYDYFTFGEALDPTPARALAKAEPEGASSDLTGALAAVQEHYGGADVGGVVVVSDGIDSGGIGARVRRGEELDQSSLDLLGELRAPVNTIAAVTEGDLKDVAITRVLRDDFAFVHNKVSVDVELQVVGLEPTRFPVSLYREGELLQTREIVVQPDQSRYEVAFEFVPRQIGKEIYTVRAPEFDGEVLLENNVSHFVQKVIRDKIRALQVVGRPSWDERFLRRMLKQNPNVDLISFFILRTNENPQLAPNDELSLIPFPTEELFEEELGSFDLVIFQNFNFGPYQMRRYLPEIAEFVRKGGGFVMIGGDLSFASGGYARTPIEEILPVQLPSTGGDEAGLIDPTPFRPELTDIGLRHPITQLAFDPVSNTRIWSTLPEQKGTNLVLGARPEATVLATHPKITTGGGPMPVLTVSEVDDGRVMALTTDSTWRWAFESLSTGGTPREYQVFWNGAIRWLIKDPELKLLKVDAVDDTAAPGSTMQATVRLSKPDYTPAPDAEGHLVVTRRALRPNGPVPAGEAEVITRLPFTTDARGRVSLEIPIESAGVYTLTATARTRAGELSDTDVVLSVPDVSEWRDIVPRDALLSKIAEATGGAYASADDAEAGMLQLLPPRTVQVNRRTVIHLWDSFPLFALILGLLGIEWTLRRRWGRL